jgi:hypothetical protein
MKTSSSLEGEKDKVQCKRLFDLGRRRIADGIFSSYVVCFTLGFDGADKFLGPLGEHHNLLIKISVAAVLTGVFMGCYFFSFSHQLDKNIKMIATRSRSIPLRIKSSAILSPVIIGFPFFAPAVINWERIKGHVLALNEISPIGLHTFYAVLPFVTDFLILLGVVCLIWKATRVEVTVCEKDVVIRDGRTQEVTGRSQIQEVEFLVICFRMKTTTGKSRWHFIPAMSASNAALIAMSVS